jgi:hypothetical protein
VGYAVSFDGWDFQTHDVIVDQLDIEFDEAADGGKAAVPDRASTPEGTMAGARITLGGTIRGTDFDDLHSRYLDLLKHTRGTDRVKKGQLAIKTGRHYWAQRVGTPRISYINGAPGASFLMQMYADDPFQRADTPTTVAELTSASDPTISVDFGSEILGDAYRIPLVVSCNALFVAGEVLRITNSTLGWTFEKVVETTIASGQTIVVDGELHEVLENGEPSGRGIAGTFPYLRGGVTNVISVAGSSRFGTITLEFVDRYLA